MAISARTIRIAGASLVSVVLIGGAYLLGGPNPFTSATANAASTQELLKAYAAKDSDHDGLPDWEEALYGTDPNNAHSVDAALTDSEAVAKGLVKPKFSTASTTTPATSLDQVPSPGADTLTDQFARALFTQYLQQTDPTNPPSADEVAAFVQQAVDNLVASHRVPDAYAAADVIAASGTGPDALRAYAAAVQQAYAANTIPNAQDPLTYLDRGLLQDGATAFATLTAESKADALIAKALMQIPAPKEAAASHLEMANALMHMSAVAADMAAYPKDPLRAELGIGLYQDYAPKVLQSLQDLYQVFHAEQVSIPAGQPGAKLYSALAAVAPQ